MRFISGGVRRLRARHRWYRRPGERGAGDMTSNKAVSDKQIEKELEDDWVERHISEAPNVLREFLGGDGLSLEGKSVVDIGCGDGLIDWGIATSQNPARLVGVDLERTDANDLIRRLRGHGLDAC